MKKTIIIIGTLIATMIVGQGVAQSTEDICKEKISALSLMTGDWSGGGWMMTQESGRVEFTQKEQISLGLNGTVINIQGQGWNPDGEIIHNALGIISFESEVGEYAMHSFLENGRQIKANLEVQEDGKIKWWFSPTENAVIEYIIDINGNTWTEKGKYSPDGTTWFPFIEFVLTKS